MDRRKSVLNVGVSIAFKLATMVMGILVRRTLIQNCGNDINGLNSLYLSIIGFLAIAELGVGSAITFCMYRPIVENDNKKVSALYCLFRKLYLLIGGIILICGLVLAPFVHHFAKDYGQLNVNLCSTFVLMLLSVVITYLFGAQQSLINAYKNNYLTTAISSGGILLQHVLQIFVLKRTGSFYFYLCCRIVAALVQWFISSLVTRKRYAFILGDRQNIDAQTKVELVKHIRAMFMHKVGGLLVNSADSIVISTFVGVSILGKYSNYLTISGAMVSVMDLFFVSLTSIFGHLYVREEKKVTQNYFEMMHLVNFLLGEIFFLGYYAVVDSLICVLFGDNLLVPKLLLFILTINGFTRFMRDSALTFRDATGTFYQDRWKPLVEGSVNLVLSVLLASEFGVVGVIGATLITNLFVCHIVEPYVLYKYAFLTSPKGYYTKNYMMIAIFAVEIMIMDSLRITGGDVWTEVLLNGGISLSVSIMTGLIVVFFEKRLRRFIVDVIKVRNK